MVELGGEVVGVLLNLRLQVGDVAAVRHEGQRAGLHFTREGAQGRFEFGHGGVEGVHQGQGSAAPAAPLAGTGAARQLLHDLLRHPRHGHRVLVAELVVVEPLELPWYGLLLSVRPSVCSPRSQGKG